MGRGGIRFDAYRFVQVGERLLELALAGVGDAAALVRLREAWVERKRPGVVGDRAAVLPHALVQHAAVVVIARIARLALQNLLVVLDRRLAPRRHRCRRRPGAARRARLCLGGAGKEAGAQKQNCRRTRSEKHDGQNRRHTDAHSISLCGRLLYQHIPQFDGARDVRKTDVGAQPGANRAGQSHRVRAPRDPRWKSASTPTRNSMIGA